MRLTPLHGRTGQARRACAARRGALRVAVCAAAFGSCVDGAVTGSRSGGILVIERIEAVGGGGGATPSRTWLESDVLTRGGVFADVGRVTTRLALKDPGSAAAPAAPTTTNYVTVTRYRVVYRRTDGRSTPGVDVPFPVHGAVTFTTGVGVRTADFVLVRASAKLEPPLRALAGGGGAVVVNAQAEVTFYGADQAGAAVQATGAIDVAFADWADEGDGDGRASG